MLGFYLKHHGCLLGFFFQIDIVMPFYSPQLELDWESMSNFLRLERNLHIFGHIFLAVSIFLFWPTKVRGTNVRQFPTNSNFQIMNISSCLGVISFYFPPLEVVHPVNTLNFVSSLNSVIVGILLWRSPDWSHIHLHLFFHLDIHFKRIFTSSLSLSNSFNLVLVLVLTDCWSVRF